MRQRKGDKEKEKDRRRQTEGDREKKTLLLHNQSLLYFCIRKRFFSEKWFHFSSLSPRQRSHTITTTTSLYISTFIYFRNPLSLSYVFYSASKSFPNLYHGTFIVSRHCLLFQSFSLSYKPDLIPVLYSRPYPCLIFQTLSMYYIPDLFPVLYSRPYLCSLFQTLSLSFIPALIPVPVLFPVLQPNLIPDFYSRSCYFYFYSRPYPCPFFESLSLSFIMDLIPVLYSSPDF